MWGVPMTVIRVLCLAAISALTAYSAAIAADCSALTGSWVTYQTDSAGNPAARLAISRGSRLDWFDNAPGGLFAAPLVVIGNDGQEAHGGCVEAPDGEGVDILMGALPLSSTTPGNEIYALRTGDSPTQDILEVNGTSYRRQ
jgi:hypothetical protein